MSTSIKTWRERIIPGNTALRVPEHRVYYAMQAEINDLRVALAYAQDSCESNAKAAEDYYREKQRLLDQRENWRCLAAKFEQERDKLKAQLQELNLQYISDFGQLQESSFDFANTTMALVEDYAKAVHDGDDAACAVLQKTIRASLEQYTTVPLTGEVRLWDSQWINVVDHDHGYYDWPKEDAICHAVKMTEQLIAKNVAENNLPPKPKE